MPTRGLATEKVLGFLRSLGIGKTFSTADIERATKLRSKSYWTILKRLQDRRWIEPSGLVRAKPGKRSQRVWRILTLGDREKEPRTEAPLQPPPQKRSVNEYVATLETGDILSTRSIIEATGVTRASAHEAIQKLEKKGWISKAGLEKPPTGRPLQTYLFERAGVREGASTTPVERSGRAALARFLGDPPAPRETPAPSSPPAPKKTAKKGREQYDIFDEIVAEIRKGIRNVLEIRTSDARAPLKQKEGVLLEQLKGAKEELSYANQKRREQELKIAQLTARVDELEERLKERETMGQILDQVAARIQKTKEAAAKASH